MRKRLSIVLLFMLMSIASCMAQSIIGKWTDKRVNGSIVVNLLYTFRDDGTFTTESITTSSGKDPATGLTLNFKVQVKYEGDYAQSSKTLHLTYTDFDCSEYSMKVTGASAERCREEEERKADALEDLKRTYIREMGALVGNNYDLAILARTSTTMTIRDYQGDRRRWKKIK